MKVAMLTGGGDCPGLNAVLRAVVRKGERHYGDTLLGFRDGWKGAMEGDSVPLDVRALRGTLPRGGTVIGSSRTNPFKIDGGPQQVLEQLAAAEVDALVAIGGEDTLGVAHRLHEELGVHVVGVPKTIDNDLSATEVTFGFNTAVQIATDAIDRLHTTAESHDRVMVCEVMGRHAGHIATWAGIAGGATMVLIPEEPFDIEEVCAAIVHRHEGGRYASIVVVAEGATPKEGTLELASGEVDQFGHVRLGGIGQVLADEIEERTGYEARVTILGHVQRGGTPTAFDRVLSTRFGIAAIDAVHDGDFGTMVALRADEIVRVPLSEGVGELKTVDPELYHGVAQVFFGEGVLERLTAAAAEDLQRRIAGGLAVRGAGEGDRVAVVAPSSALLLATVLAALRRGIVPVVLNPALLDHEVDALVLDAEVVDRFDGPALADLSRAAPVELSPVPRARPMHYTSGTTGWPKGVWSGVLTEAQGAALVAEEAELWGFDPGDRHLVCSPLHHSAPIRFAAGTLLAGGEVAVLDRFRPEGFVEGVAEVRPTTAFLVPAHLQRLRAAGGADLSSFRLVAHAGAPCSEPLKRWALEACPEGSVWEFYGSTEGQFTVCGPDEWQAHPGTVGRARPHRHLEVDEDGTIWCQVPDHARFAYWGDPEATARAWRGDAFTVGDLGRLDGDGYLYLDGRRDDLIITGGVNVYPAEVERALHDAPGVADVAVFGVDDERWGQRVCAAVVGDSDPGAVVAHARSRLAPYKCPKEVFVVDDLPRTATGKVRRLDLADRFGQPSGRKSV